MLLVAEESASEAISVGPLDITSVVGTVFSTAALTAIAVLFSGKLIARRIRINLPETDVFSLNLGILRIRAQGDEVACGFLMFILAVAATAAVGGEPAYLFFKSRSGIDLGQWSSLCAIAGLVSVIVSIAVWAIAPLFRVRPLLSGEERSAQIAKITEQTPEDHSDGSQ